MIKFIDNHRRLVTLALVLSLLISLRIVYFNQNDDTESNNNTYIDAGKSAKIFPQITNLLETEVEQLYPSQPASLVKGLVLGVDDLDKDFKKIPGIQVKYL